MFEEIYVVSVKGLDGDWHKLVKSQENWWYTKEEAIKWLSYQEPWFRQSNAVFKMLIEDKGEKVFDGKDIVEEPL